MRSTRVHGALAFTSPVLLLVQRIEAGTDPGIPHRGEPMPAGCLPGEEVRSLKGEPRSVRANWAKGEIEVSDFVAVPAVVSVTSALS